MRYSMRVAPIALALSSLLTTGKLAASDGGVRFVGADMCKRCHLLESKGGAYRHWSESAHRTAFQTLSSDKAKKIAKERNVADPASDKACLPCHVTAYGAPAALKDEAFDQKLGVQCESCHGPGGRHSKRRLEELENESDVPVAIPPGEIAAVPSVRVCERCHNEQVPTSKPFVYAEALKKISHLDLRKKYPADYLDKLGAQGGTQREPTK